MNGKPIDIKAYTGLHVQSPTNPKGSYQITFVSGEPPSANRIRN
jgi:hypothetical protein